MPIFPPELRDGEGAEFEVLDAVLTEVELDIVAAEEEVEVMEVAADEVEVLDVEPIMLAILTPWPELQQLVLN